MPFLRAPAPRRLPTFRTLTLRGRGRVVLQLRGTGHVTLRRGRCDDVCFEGEGLPRHVSAACVHLTAATGQLTLEGEALEVAFSGGRADGEVTGVFEVDLQGAEPGPGRGLRRRRRAA